MRPAAFIATLIVATTFATPPTVLASEGHAHGVAAPALNGPAPWPRFALVSETFELVGVVRGRRVTLYLDRTADNAPVTHAVIDIDMGGNTLRADPLDGAYEVMLPAEPRAGVLPVIATVTAGNEVDLLAGELDIHESAPAEGAAHTDVGPAHAGWAAVAIPSLIALLTVLLVVLIRFGRQRAAARRARAGAVA